jgi:hypothetical protein
MRSLAHWGQMPFHQVRRREFITLLGGAAAWPLGVRAQTKQMRRIGVLMGLVAGDPEAQSRVVAFENRFANVAGLIRRKNRRVDVKADRAGRHRKRNPVAREQRAKVSILEHRSDTRKILCCQNLNPANNSVSYRTPDKGARQSPRSTRRERLHRIYAAACVGRQPARSGRSPSCSPPRCG